MIDGKYSIGEICRICNVTSSRLRYYDERGLIKPAFVDRENGYRYYDSDATVLISVIKYYQACGFKLKDIRELLDSGDLNVLREMFEERIRELDEEIVSLTIQRDSISAWNSLIREGQHAAAHDDRTVYRKTFRQTLMYVNTPYMLEDMQYESLVADIELFNHIPGEGYNTVGPFYVYFHDGNCENIKESKVFINPHPLECSGVFKETAGGFNALCTYSGGASAGFEAGYERIREYADEHDITLRGDSFHRSVIDRWSTASEHDFMIEIIMPVDGPLDNTEIVTFGE